MCARLIAQHQAMSTTVTGKYQKGQSGNPAGRPKSSSPDQGGLTVDGWANFVSGLGTAKFDKRLQNRMQVCPVGTVEARAIYAGSSMGARLVESRVKEMWRPGFEVIVKDLAPNASAEDVTSTPVVGAPRDTISPSAGMRMDGARSKASRRLMRRLNQDALTEDLKTISKRAAQRFRRLKGKKRFREAMHYANAYGAGAVLIGANDGQAWKEPLDKSRVQSIDFLTSFEADEFTPIAWYERVEDTADGAGKFGQPLMYQITPKSQSRVSTPVIYVHESRLIVFDGIRTSRQTLGTINNHGDSCFTRVKQTLSDFDMGFASVGIFLQEMSISCMKIKDLASAAATAEGQKKIYARLAAVAMGKSIANMTLLDADGESFEQHSASVSGVADLLQMLMQRVAADFDMPVTVLMGTSPAGLNATGASDIRQWYDDIAAERGDVLDDPLHDLFGMLLRTMNGGKEPGDWCIEWRPMWQQDPKQKAEIFNLYATADSTNIQNQIYTAEEARKSRFGGQDGFGETITIETDESLEYDPTEIADYKAGAQVTDPNAPVAPTGVGGDADIQKTALNGTQVTAMQTLVQSAANGELPAETVKLMLEIAFQLSHPDAERIMKTLAGFSPKKPDPEPAPFDGGAPFKGPPSEAIK